MLATNECPRLTASEEDTATWSSLLAHYRAGHLWSGGGVSGQPQIYLDVMKMLEHWSNKLAP